MDALSPDDARSKEELRFAYVSKQGFDRSCGYAAATSLLGLYWNIHVDENELIERYAPDSEEAGLFGVSFEVLARIFSDYGFAVKGVRMNWDQLAAALNKYSPILVHYSRPDRHFALALSIKEGWIITLDPALGCELQSRDQFRERWSGAALLIDSMAAKRDDARLAEAERIEWDRQDLLERLGP